MELGLFLILVIVGIGLFGIGVATDSEIPCVLGMIMTIGLLIFCSITPTGKWTYVKHPATGTIVNEQIIVQAKDPNIDSVIETNMRFIGKEVDIVEIQPRNVWGGNMGSMFQVELKGKAEQ
jgi:hypothetical protein